jgi:hypothetical protein
MTKRTSSSALQSLASVSNPDPRIIEFKSSAVLHDRFESAIIDVADRIQHASQQSITAVLGPTGSGKTAFSKEVQDQFRIAASSVPNEQRTMLLYLELAASETAKFNWKINFYQPALELLQEPYAKGKIDIEALRALRFEGRRVASYGATVSLAEYRQLLDDAMSRARVKAFLIDEANHFRRSSDSVFHQYDVIKSRSNASAAHFVLIGTTGTLDIFEQSGQISRRVYPIWLTPYEPSEMPLFVAAVLGIKAKLPVAITFDIADVLGDFYEESFGLIGVVHEWFEKALIKCCASGRDKLDWADFEATRLHEIQRSGILGELISFKEFQAKHLESFVQRKSHLFGPKPDPERTVSSDPRKKRKAFQRKAGRDGAPQ